MDSIPFSFTEYDARIASHCAFQHQPYAGLPVSARLSVHVSGIRSIVFSFRLTSTSSHAEQSASLKLSVYSQVLGTLSELIRLPFRGSRPNNSVFAACSHYSSHPPSARNLLCNSIKCQRQRYIVIVQRRIINILCSCQKQIKSLRLCNDNSHFPDNGQRRCIRTWNMRFQLCLYLPFENMVLDYS